MIKTAIDTATFGVEHGGSVAFVGAGPGDKDLITLRGVQRLQNADVIFYDEHVDPQILELARRDAERIYIKSPAECLHWPPQKTVGLLVSMALSGKRIVRLVRGCSQGGVDDLEEQEALAAAGVSCETVPGVALPPAAPEQQVEASPKRALFSVS